MAIGQTQMLLSVELRDVESMTCRSVRLDAQGRPLGPQLDDLGCGVMWRPTAIGDDFLVAPDTPDSPLRLVRADGRVERLELADLPVPCASCVAGAWRHGDSVIILAAHESDEALHRYTVRAGSATRSPLADARLSLRGSFRAMASRDARGVVLLGIGYASGEDVWVHRLDLAGESLGAARAQPVKALVWGIRPVVRDEVHAYVESDAQNRTRLVFASTATTALRVGPWLSLQGRPAALAASSSGFVLRSHLETVELDARGALVSRTPVTNPSEVVAIPAGVVEVSLSDYPEPSILHVGDHVAFEAPLVPRSITAVRIVGGRQGALIAWDEVSRRGFEGVGLVRIDPSGDAAAPILVADAGPVRWMAATDRGYLLGVSRDLVRVHADGTTERVPDAGVASGEVAVVGGRAFAIDADLQLTELDRADAPRWSVEGRIPRLFPPDTTGERALVGSSNPGSTSGDLHLQLFDATGLLDATVTIPDVHDYQPTSWTCGPGCWEFEPYEGTKQWRVTLEGDELRATRLPQPSQRFVAAAMDDCRQVRLDQAGSSSPAVLTSPKTPHPPSGEFASVARVGPDRFWIVTRNRHSLPTVTSLEP